MDRFDSLLIHSGTILSNDSDPEDAYGQESRPVASWDVVATNVPCRVDPEGGTEFKTDLKVSINTRTVFMRSPVLSDGQKLNPHHTILVSDFPSVYLNVIRVDQLFDAGALHHLEVICEEINTLNPAEFGS